MQRVKDWFRQAEADLDAAKNLLESKNYEWACFASQQSAEKSVKAKLNEFGYEMRGHSIVELLEYLEKKCIGCMVCIEACREGALDYKVRHERLYRVGRKIYQLGTSEI